MHGAGLRMLGACLVMVAALALPAAAQGPRGGPPDGPMPLLLSAEVQRELKVDADQFQRLRRLGLELRLKSFDLTEEIQRLPPEQRERRLGAFRQEMQRRIGEVLDARQETRFRQIELQFMGPRAILRPDVAGDLKLSGEQRRRARAAVDGERQAIRSGFRDFRPGRQVTPEQREEARRRFAEVHAATDAQLTGLLTDAQRKQFTEMQGAPFKLPPRPLRPPGGAGGPGGRGGPRRGP